MWNHTSRLPTVFVCLSRSMRQTAVLSLSPESEPSARYYDCEQKTAVVRAHDASTPTKYASHFMCSNDVEHAAGCLEHSCMDLSRPPTLLQRATRAATMPTMVCLGFKPPPRVRSWLLAQDLALNTHSGSDRPTMEDLAIVCTDLWHLPRLPHPDGITKERYSKSTKQPEPEWVSAEAGTDS